MRDSARTHGTGSGLRLRMTSTSSTLSPSVTRGRLNERVYSILFSPNRRHSTASISATAPTETRIQRMFMARHAPSPDSTGAAI